MAGVGLIEVLIAVVILAFGMLGIAAMQATSLRNSQSALERSQATVQTYTILDAMRANRDVALIGGYNLTSWTCDPLDPGDLAANDRRKWIESLEETLGDTPNTCGKIVCGSVSCTISVKWDDSRGTGGQVETVETVTKL